MPKVSIILPVYNAEQHIERTAEVLLNQTEPDVELIFVDDGSNDNSRDILERTVEKDVRCKLVVQENKGPGSARNAGMEIAQGEYLLFLDIDDFFKSNLVEELYHTAKRADADVTICAAKTFNERLEMELPLPSALDIKSVPYERDIFSPEEISGRLFQVTGGFAWNKLFKASFVRQAGLYFPETYCYEDLQMLSIALLKSKKIAVTHKELVIYRINAGSSLSDNRDKYWRNLIGTISKIKETLQDGHVYELYEQTFLNKSLDLLAHCLKSYLREEAFSNVYDYTMKYLMDEFSKHGREYYYDPDSYRVLECLRKTPSMVDFALALFHIKVEGTGDIYKKFWPFPYWSVKRGSNIILFGAGDIGRDMFIQATQSGWCNVVAWVDSFPEKYSSKGFPVVGKKVIQEIVFDQILVCVKDGKIALSIKNEVLSMGVCEDKIWCFTALSQKDELVVKG